MADILHVLIGNDEKMLFNAVCRISLDTWQVHTITGLFSGFACHLDVNQMYSIKIIPHELVSLCTIYGIDNVHHTGKSGCFFEQFVLGEYHVVCFHFIYFLVFSGLRFVICTCWRSLFSLACCNNPWQLHQSINIFVFFTIIVPTYKTVPILIVVCELPSLTVIIDYYFTKVSYPRHWYVSIELHSHSDVS